MDPGFAGNSIGVLIRLQDNFRFCSGFVPFDPVKSSTRRFVTDRNEIVILMP